MNRPDIMSPGNGMGRGSFIPRILIIINILLLCLPWVKADTGKTAANSVLATGKWAKIKVTESGMHIIPEATLRNLGFSDPSKVHIYGLGGVPQSETFKAGMPDDLPLQASVYTSKGLLFFADNHISWDKDDSGGYVHTIHPFSDDSYYFISDRDTVAGMGNVELTQSGSNRISTFLSRVVHEKELAHLGKSGRTYLGEDFRATNAQTFSLATPGNTGEEAILTTQFCARVTGGGSTISLKANGSALPYIGSDSIIGSKTEQYGVLATSTRNITFDGSKLDVNISYRYNGALFMARLNYIELLYNRRMELESGELHVYGDFRTGDELVITGCDDSTVIWDITNRAKPLVVDFNRSGSTAIIGIDRTDYREFIAFNPGTITRQAVAAGSVDNQDLHGLEAPDMVIISPATYKEGASIIADLHSRLDNMKVEIIDPNLIYNEFSSGKPDITAYRKLLKMWYDRGVCPRYCLIMGKPSYDYKGTTTDVNNAGYTPVPIWQSEESLSELSSYCTDDYITMLDEVPESDTKGFVIEKANMHVAVGRLPVKSSAEAIAVARKLENHAENATRGVWRNKIMIIADDGDNNSHFDQAELVYKGLRSEGSGESYLYDRVYLDTYTLTPGPTGNTYPQATSRMLSNYNEGVIYTNYSGHGSEIGWGHEQLWTWSQITGMANKNLTLILAATCRFCPWDEPGVSGAEHLMLNEQGGAIGLITTTRTVFIPQNGRLNEYVSKEFFKPGADGRMRTPAEILTAGKNAYKGDGNRLRYVFIGDPALRLNNITHRIEIDSINGLSVNDSIPVIPAGSSISLTGRILDPDGNESGDFDGTIALQLYDAESVIETNGNNGANETAYNDRKTRLALANASVKGGKWHSVFTVPMEIINNYSPALVSAYAWDESGREANGHTERLYVYGFSTEAHDTVGPTIDFFRLNRADFKDGDIVNPNPIVFARIYDESGINISDGGVGHRISLRLDNNAPYENVAQSFSPEGEEGLAGLLSYVLKDLPAGSHTLTLEVWDNFNNATRASIDFGVSASADPYIIDLYTDANPASSSVNFIMNVDVPNTKMNFNLSVHDLSGRTVWEYEQTENTGLEGTVKIPWNLCHKSGTRVPRGIYLYKVRVETPEGTWNSKTGKLAVTAN